MADFATVQAQLKTARLAQDAAQLALAQAQNRSRRAQETLDLARREADVLDDSGRIATLTAALENAVGAQSAASKALQAARSDVVVATSAFGNFSSPQQNISALNDSSPFLLVPVRIETRFRIVSGNGNPAPAGGPVAAVSHQLLVRIYPDDCSIDTFEALLSDSELANVKTYWMNQWRAGGVEGDQRGAWSKLVAAHGSGRAGWLVDNFQPINLSEEPKKSSPSDEVLVIPAQIPLAPAQAEAIADYWKSFWVADGDADKVNEAGTTLSTAVGASTAADLIASYAPFNMADRPAAPLTKNMVTLSVSFLIFPADPLTNQQTWSQAPQVRQFPDRFVVLGFNGTVQTIQAVGNPVTVPLYTGPDPSADPNTDPTSSIHPDGPDLFIPDQLKWMVDFETAVDAGMALTIPITAEQYAAGFSRVLVLGLQLGTSAVDGAAGLQELFSHHQWSRSGFSLLNQGTPTHNTTGTNAGATVEDDADASFDDRRDRTLFTVTTDPTQKLDGQWLAEFLSIDTNFLAGVQGCRGVDQMQARAMQAALWPATFGYWMDTLFTPSSASTSIFSDQVIAQTRELFTFFVSGRGALPALRIGGQPYGVLPTTAFSRIQWYENRSVLTQTTLSQSFLGSLCDLLRKLDSNWTTFSQAVSYLGKPGDPHQTLLDVLALEASSVEYFTRNAESLSLLFNLMNRYALGPAWFSALSKRNLEQDPVALLRSMGYSGAELPDLLNHFFWSANPQIGTVIDDVPLSETAPIRAYTDDDRNYLEWLADAAGTSLDVLREESGFSENKSPQALLYLFTRHALLLGYYNASYNLHRDSGVLSAANLLKMKVEPSFVHVAEGANSESRFASLYKVEPAITGSPTVELSDYITQNLITATAAADLAAQINAVKSLVNASTSQLERLFAEHVDTCSYRYDAWMLALVSQRLTSQLSVGDGQQQPRGIYLGAYAWVEDLHPSTDQLTPATIEPDLVAQFDGGTPLLADAQNGGYIHAPSMPHANAAAVLRAGFLASQADGSNTGELSVNLSSDRVRAALALIDGIRTGQSLGALLGYQFEVGLHDEHQLAEVDKFIYPLRKAFPLVADALASTKSSADTPIQAIEARNVLDGKKLVDQITSTGKTSYPWGVDGLPAANSDEQKALNGTADALLNSYDAVADLAMAEGVYQAVQGNYDRVASTVAAYTTGNFPPEPEIVNFSPPGFGITHRFAIHLRPGLAPPPGATPRAQVEPAIDGWLSSLLPPLDHVGSVVSWIDPVTATAQQHAISLADLGLRPIDTLFLLKPDSVQSMAELDDRIQRFVATTFKPRPDASIQVQYLVGRGGPGDFSIFELAPLLRNLRSLLANSRPVRATDIRRPNDATQDDNSNTFVDRSRITAPLADLNTLAEQINSFLTATLAPLLADTGANRAQIIANTDTLLTTGVDLLERAARLALPSSGWGFVYDWLHLAFADLMGAVHDLVDRWAQKLSAFNTGLTAYDALPMTTSDAIRMATLNKIQILVAAQIDPALTTPAALRAALPAKAASFQSRLGEFQAILAGSGTSFANLYTSVTSLSTAEFDTQPFNVSSIGDRAIVITQDLSRVLTNQYALATSVVNEVNTQLAAAASVASSSDQTAALTAAAKALLGTDFQIVPEFTVSAAQGAEWANALTATASGAPFVYAKETLQIDFPVEEWFYGAARVRAPLGFWETTLMLAEAFGRQPAPMTPIQLPFDASAPWLAVQFPETYIVDSDRLLYTCLYSQAFDATGRQCGILVDEWTEVIPSTTQDTALTFNYARPDNEPPQTMLLVTSPSVSGTWQWDDLVAALNETLDLAKKRGVEPAMLDPTAYSRFLPATVTASTTYGITIATTLAASNGVMAKMQGETDA